MSEVIDLKARKAADTAQALLEYVNSVHSFALRLIDRFEARGADREALCALVTEILKDLGQLALALQQMGVPAPLISRLSLDQMMLTVINLTAFVDSPAWGPDAAEALRKRLNEAMTDLTLSARGS